MIIDPSALVAILRAEPEVAAYAKAIEAASQRRMSAANLLEAAVVLDSARDPVVSRRFDELVTAAQISVEPVTEVQARIAREAYRDFGKGSGHPAGLNFGDCFAPGQFVGPAGELARVGRELERHIGLSSG